MRKILFAILVCLSSIASASSVVVVKAEYDKENQILTVETLVNKGDDQTMYLKWGVCQETYPMRCFAKIIITPNDNIGTNDDAEYRLETLKVDVGNFSKPAYLLIRGDLDSSATVFIEDPTSEFDF